MPKQKKNNDEKERRKEQVSENRSSSLEVIPVRPVEMNDTDNYHENLPKIHRNNGSITLLVGSTASGKTTTINWLLLHSNAWGGKNPAFENVYIFSPSVNCDDSCRFLRENFECYTEYRDSYLKQILETQNSYEKKDRPKCMIVIDDSVGMIGRSSTLNHFLSRYRHWNCNVIMSVQSFRALSPIARANTTDVLLFNGIFNDKEMEKIEEEYDSMYKGSLKRCYKKFASKPYTFLYLKTRKNPPQMFQNFTTEIDWKKYGRNLDEDELSEEEADNDF